MSAKKRVLKLTTIKQKLEIIKKGEKNQDLNNRYVCLCTIYWYYKCLTILSLFP